MGDEEKEDEEFVSTLGGLKIDWPRALGYYGAIGAAVAFEVIAPPLGVFIAVVPLLKLLKRQRASRLERVAAAIVEGAGKPVGGDAEGVVRLKWIDDAKSDEPAALKDPQPEAEPSLPPSTSYETSVDV